MQTIQIHHVVLGKFYTKGTGTKSSTYQEHYLVKSKSGKAGKRTRARILQKSPKRVSEIARKITRMGDYQYRNICNTKGMKREQKK